jgi:hypothetical protein
MPDGDFEALRLELERSKAARLRAWSFLQSLREVLQAAGVIIPPPAQKSFAAEGKFLERALKQALTEREEALRDLVKAARLVDRSAFGKESDFGQAHQALLKAMEQAGRFV